VSIIINDNLLSQALQQSCKSTDFITEKLHNGNEELTVYYFETLCDITVSRTRISDSFTSLLNGTFDSVLQSELRCNELYNVEEITEHLLRGSALLYYQNRLWSLSVPKLLTEELSEATIEASIQGPGHGLSENINSNINIVRQRYPKMSLLTESLSIGTASKTKITIMYDEDNVDVTVLENFKNKLNAIDVDVLQTLDQLSHLILKQKFALFPVMLTTERPDRISFNLAEGKIIVLMQGTPFALICPAIFYDFISAVDDKYQSFWTKRGIVILRYLALFLTIFLPSLYIAIVSYNPEIVRIQLAVTMAGSRAAIPYPSFIEVFIMLFIIEALIEASIRVPQYIGSTATTVGGLILGQAAQEAGLISSIMIIITSTVAIANFVIPVNSMSLAIRFVKYPIILLSIFFGISGVIIGFFCLIMYLSNIQSFGQPYFKLFFRERKTSTHD